MKACFHKHQVSFLVVKTAKCKRGIRGRQVARVQVENISGGVKIYYINITKISLRPL